MSNKTTNLKNTFIVKNISFKNNEKVGNFVLAPDVGVRFNKISDNIWETLIGVRINDSVESAFPFNLDVTVSLISEFAKDSLPNNDELIEYLKVNSVNILFPYVRSVVTNITTAAMVAPLILPILNVREATKDIVIPELMNK